MNNSVLTLIPLRFKSERFPNKLLATFKGKPVISWLSELIPSLGYDYRFLCSKDDYNIAIKYVPDVHVAISDGNDGTERIANYVMKHISYDRIILKIPADEFLLEKEELQRFISEGLSILSSHNLPVMAYTDFYDVEDLLSKQSSKVVLDDKRLVYISRRIVPYHRDDGATVYPNKYKKNVAILLAKPKHLQDYLKSSTAVSNIEKLEELRWLSTKFTPMYVHINHKYFGLDSPDQIKILEARFNNERSKN